MKKKNLKLNYTYRYYRKFTIFVHLWQYLEKKKLHANVFFFKNFFLMKEIRF